MNSSEKIIIFFFFFFKADCRLYLQVAALTRIMCCCIVRSLRTSLFSRSLVL